MLFAFTIFMLIAYRGRSKQAMTESVNAHSYRYFGSQSPVEGLLYLLRDFLKMEGVLDGSGHISSDPSYMIIEVHVDAEERRIPVFGLEGNKRCIGRELEKRALSKPRELGEYINASEQGAREQRIPTKPFEDDRDWFNSLKGRY